MKEACLLVVDVGATMTEANLSRVKSALTQFVMKTFIQAGQNEYGLVLFGADSTNNQLHIDTGVRYFSKFLHVKIMQ
jgi:hypothetical protein